MKNEIWKDVVGYEGLYKVSNLGNVRSENWRRTGRQKKLYLKKHNKGYLQVELANDGEKRMFLVHRLVAEAFIPNPNGFSKINHIDENKANNQVSNLEWCTQSQNMNAYWGNHPNRRRKPTRLNRIVQMSVDGEMLTEWENANAIYHACNYNRTSIWECCEGKRKTAYGYKWQYAI